MHLSSRVYRQFRLLAVAALVISALAASPALAKGGTPKSTGAAQCAVTPNPVPFMSPYEVSGSGFTPGAYVDILISNGSNGYILGTTLVAADGTFNMTDSSGSSFPPGTVNVYITDALARKVTLLAQCSFTSVS